MRILTWSLAIPWLVLALVGGCDDNPVDTKEDIFVCDHFAPDGFDIVQGGQNLVSQFNGITTSELSVGQGVTAMGLEVLWLDADSMHTKPAAGCTDQTLAWTVDDPAKAEIAHTAGNKWAFDLTGKAAGTTTIRLQIWHVDHADFTSFPVTVEVGTAPADTIQPRALVLVDGLDPVATHNFDTVNGPGQVTGPIVLRTGTTRADIEAWFVDPDSIIPGPEHARARVEMPNNTPHSLSWTVADETVIELVASATSKWHFDVVAKQPGKTTVQVALLFDGSARYTSGSIPVHVTALTPADRLDDYTFKKNGVRTVTVDSGLVDNARCRAANPGAFAAEAGELTDLYFTKFIDDQCGELSASGWDVRFEFEDDFIAKVLHHPFHWNEKDEFHVVGLAPGQTTVTLYLVQGGEVRIVSPPIPVVISSAALARREGG